MNYSSEVSGGGKNCCWGLKVPGGFKRLNLGKIRDLSTQGIYGTISIFRHLLSSRLPNCTVAKKARFLFLLVQRVRLASSSGHMAAL